MLPLHSHEYLLLLWFTQICHETFTESLQKSCELLMEHHPPSLSELIEIGRAVDHREPVRWCHMD